MQIYEDMTAAKATATTFSVDYNIVDAAVSGNSSADYAAVRGLLLAYVPVSNAPPGATYAWPRRGLDLKENGWGCWKATVQWASLTYQYALKIGGASQQIRCDKQLTGIYSDPAAAGVPNYVAGDNGRPIGWDGRSIHGTSIYVPTRTWTESAEIPIAQYSFDYEDRVDAVNQAPVNAKPFRGYAAGEVLFQGMQAQLSTQNPDFVTASYEFSRSPNKNGIAIDDVANISKPGWDFLDVHYEPQVPAGVSAVIPKAQYVLVHRVYDSSDFAALNIGTAEALPMWQG